jgi:hypothetical protein
MLQVSARAEALRALRALRVACACQRSGAGGGRTTCAFDVWAHCSAPPPPPPSHTHLRCSCESLCDANKSMLLELAPNILILALKRYQMERRGKLTSAVAFPACLDLEPFMAPDALDGQEASMLYRLYAVVVHLDYGRRTDSGVWRRGGAGIRLGACWCAGRAGGGGSGLWCTASSRGLSITETASFIACHPLALLASEKVTTSASFAWETTGTSAMMRRLQPCHHPRC